MKKILLLCLLSLIMNSAVQARKVRYSGSQFGLVPDQGVDMGPAMRKALESIRTAQKEGDCAVLVLDKGCYDFYPDGAVWRELYISNHDQDNPKNIGILVEDMHDITIDGCGADIMCHGTMIPIVIQNSRRITLQNLHVDFRTPHIGQAEIVQITPQGTVLKTAPWMNVRISPDGRLQHYCDEGHGAQWVCTPQAAIAFEKDTRHIVYRTSDVVLWPQKARQTGPDTYLMEGWRNERLSVGNVLALRDWSRPTPGIFLAKNQDTRLLNVQVHYADGMALVAQLCENITLDRFCVSLRGTDDPRYFTSQADATHFSGCKGKIVSRNGLYEHMMDDAINVHGTYVKVLERINDTTLRCAYQHSQSWGFDWGYAGDQVSIVRSRTMEKLDCGSLHVKSIHNLQDGTDNLFSQKQMIIQFDRTLPAEVTPDGAYGIENLTWTPSVDFTHNTIRNNRARGSLFSTPRKVVCEDNFFDHTSGTAILLCGDCNGWYETGACRDVLIRKNRFLNALTSPFQFTNAVISIYPEIPDLGGQKECFHGGPLKGNKYAIRITDNIFETFDNPLLYAKSVDGLLFRNNRVIRNSDFPAFHWIKQPVTLEHVTNSSVSVQDTVQYTPGMSECISFLYKNMYRTDSVDYPLGYWKKQARLAIRARKEMPWGTSVPRWEFLNFVLPVRVNSEALDNAREVIYKELVPRLKGLTMAQAALEVNHWCHEHVSYRPSDARTYPPLATMANAIGRCGEESTFTVAALRAVGIPARQVYCPRWAHTDDNHAWVEVWVNDSGTQGSWHFMGACEPEATLDKGWFNWAASRAMLVRTQDHAGNTISTTQTYAPTKTLKVHVVDETGQPLSGATVDFRLYNYSEFYPLHSVVTDSDGNAQFTTGYGDLQVWVSKDGKYGVKKADAVSTQLTVVPCYSAGAAWTEQYDWHVPQTALQEPDRSVVDTVSENGRRLMAEDKIRTAYQQKTFYAGDNQLLRQARSNWRVIDTFLKEGHPNTDLVIKGLSEKDLSDVTIQVLHDACLMPEAGLRSGGVRVSTEPLRPYVAFLQKKLKPMTAAEWIAWVERNITVDDTRNPKRLAMSVVGVYNNRRCNAYSRELFTVAGARALGLKAELNPVGKAVVEGLLLPTRGTSEPMGTLKLDVPADVMYYHGYTISRMVDGRPVSLNYADDDPTVTRKFREGLQLPAGDYLLTTGTRLAGGDVLTHSVMFTLRAYQTTTVPVIFRKSDRSVKSDLRLDDSEKNASATSIQSAQ